CATGPRRGISASPWLLPSGYSTSAPTRRNRRVGRCRPSHSCPVSASLPAQDQVHDPAAPHMRAGTAKMIDNSGVLAPGLFQRIGKHGEAGRIEIAGRQAASLVNLLGQPDQRAVAPGKHRGGNGHGPERVTHDITEQLTLLDKSGVPRSNASLPCLTWAGENA